MQIAVVKYNAGNIRSVLNALQRIGCEPILTDSPERLLSADKVIFPGQGSAGPTMSYLREHGLDKVITHMRQPVLGICIGQQLLCRHSEEDDADCLGLFDVDVKRFRPRLECDKVPAMGWNNIYGLRSKLFQGIDDGEFAYFVHSYYVPLCEHTIATADYVQPFSAALNMGNFYATQFHPEKSGDIGEKILKNFIENII